MMSECVKRVARALYVRECARQGAEPNPQPLWESMDISCWLAAARVAIAAMREPTPDMLRAAWKAPLTSDALDVPIDDEPYGASGGTVGCVLEYDNKGPDVLYDAWRAAVDEALSE